ncbi:zinc finger CCCH domain-containing protein 3 [Entelurus aequoreus]|uniref:zinc finger CCCH domain-containing protein 3 n=1 Tax=Entelurus aequoreus TaxID=161455 RepID=UPI002B1D8353|nr:zinc finger CCCH domain-containing protein 3 [Entelurus aequoreus]XP_061883952.1 zinc finger CCCH domain-containing protein 3 [Entelurus aequoreus]
MEEREALKRQIDLLQSLINKHKSLHGDTPRASEVSTSSRGRNHSTSVIHPHNLRRSPLTNQSHGSWRKTYSLKNKNPISTVSTSVSHSSLPSSHAVGETSSASKPSTASSKTVQVKKVGQAETGLTGIKNIAKTKRVTSGKVLAVSQAPSVAKCIQPERQQQKGSSESRSPAKDNTLTGVHVKPQFSFLNSKTNQTQTQHLDDKKQTVQNKSSSTQSSFAKVQKQPSHHPLSQSNQARGRFSKSKFTWVKNQSGGGTEPSTSSCSRAVSSPTGRTLDSKVATLSSPGIRKTPAKRFTRKAIPTIPAPRTSKYQWVSSTARTQAKTSRKSLSPKLPTNTQRFLEIGETPKKIKPASSTSTKLKKRYATCSPVSPFSRYRWKAGGSGAGWDHRRSSFVWTSEKINKGAKKGLVSSVLPQCAAVQSSPSAFKLRSRMKIIRRSDNSGSPSVKGGVPSGVKYSPRGRMHSATRFPTGARRTPTREFVSFGRHKLRRVSPSLLRTSQAMSFHCSPASQRICRTQYKKVNWPGPSVAHTLPYNATLSWRAKKIQSARSFLQSRQRSCHNRYPAPLHHWKESSVCWIRGSLYQVSANKLSRKVCHNMAINRTGRSFNASHVSPTNLVATRSNSSRHLASRAVQRSLTIIRQARQKKQPRQYCMYYNRFGKCNRGTSCPYIHDPDKVAVCTRFLRGTCKQADGTCPFSHKVAKEKMPVCSYFLKGICNNSDCPYSHVYVSHKAKVCEDFVRGYCPEGEKCKKKHTLLCPDFSKTGSCPQGARCKLQHRQRTKRTASTPVRPRIRQLSKSPCLSEVVLPQGSQETPGTSASSLLALPSFISLSSSPEEPDTPDTLQAKTSQVKDKKLQIKPLVLRSTKGSSSGGEHQ